jgi:hypothetical protein
VLPLPLNRIHHRRMSHRCSVPRRVKYNFKIRRLIRIPGVPAEGVGGSPLQPDAPAAARGWLKIRAC